jgi:hypothetical protein
VLLLHKPRRQWRHEAAATLDFCVMQHVLLLLLLLLLL